MRPLPLLGLPLEGLPLDWGEFPQVAIVGWVPWRILAKWKRLAGRLLEAAVFAFSSGERERRNRRRRRGLVVLVARAQQTVTNPASASSSKAVRRR